MQRRTSALYCYYHQKGPRILTVGPIIIQTLQVIFLKDAVLN